jgi:hypothetical protein
LRIAAGRAVLLVDPAGAEVGVLGVQKGRAGLEAGIGGEAILLHQLDRPAGTAAQRQGQGHGANQDSASHRRSANRGALFS